MDTDVYSYVIDRLEGGTLGLAEYADRVLLIVNTASECGFTPQYAGLEAMHERLAPQGFSVLGFPCNQFAGQEPGDERAIETFCSMTYGVTFPMFAKVDVNGPDAHPLWKHLKGERPGFLGTEAIKWNFTKFLVGRDGTVLKRYAPTDEPSAIEPDVARMLV